ncbi:MULTISPECIES: serine/threonine-protein kinase [unclassified Ruminococcus]|uniref:serine/threonine-protein kinase n=1 Tax=unclassified Ruminococcus TaxID=2608920 RepID=UPI00189C9496|nr:MULTISPECIES: serine/threonine-protein kinase [unclassified Ruminococcus]MDB8757534.1 serine/threonine-protein kinase [Ruminococcus sp. 1001136sp1]MDB8761562.1 serine/threonine-protein kinase [Ruminococcus sp. 1001136sp1]MDB8765626.1 serine/threonine-protein kinase [Ruminococcus sp. 1001136sp1]MDB8769557.1 serine/threonine-protein kinase [Ruminococcus sp. 1001136sp1]
MDKDVPVSVWPEWELIEKIGEGSFGKVYKAKRTERGRSFYSAIKIISIPASKGELDSVRSEMNNEQSTREYFRNLVEDCIQEIYTMEHFCGNSHVVSFEDFKVVEYLDEIGWDISIRMEYLTSFMDYCTGKELTEKEVIKLGCDLAMALIYCRKLNIIHRDVKPENIFVSRFGDFKLGDFGIAREQAHTMSNMSKKGTYSYMAPEIYKGEKYDSSIDIYSLGIVLYKLMNQNRLPFLSLDKQLITYRDKETALARRMAGEKMPVPVNASAAFSHIILKACAYEPGKRYRKPEDMLRDLEKLRLAPVNAEKEWEKSQWELTNSAELERDQRRYAPQEPEDRMERTHVAEDPQIEKAVREEEAQLRKPAKNAVKNYEKQSVNASSTKRKKQQRSGWNQERQISPWTVSLIVVALAACIIIGVYMKLIHDENRKAQNTENVMEVLEANDNSTAQIDEFSTSIQTIKEQANTIVSELPDCEEVGKEGDRLRYYDSNGKLVKALIYPETSEDGVYEEYYYWDERLFFAYVWTGNKKELYYYDKRGKLIRWINTDGTVHDKENDSTEYTKRGEKYWKNALEQLDE